MARLTTPKCRGLLKKIIVDRTMKSRAPVGTQGTWVLGVLPRVLGYCTGYEGPPPPPPQSDTLGMI